MKPKVRFRTGGAVAALACVGTLLATASEPSTNSPTPPALETRAETPDQEWNWHAQNTDIVQYHPGFPASYSGPNSLGSAK